MSSNLASKVTNGIRVDVRTRYIEDESSPKHSYFVFNYEVEISNESPVEVQLISRIWRIVDGLGQSRTVEGDGVVGKQPILAPGGSHKYKSGSHFSTAVGMMMGQYCMRRTSDGLEFWIDIPSFTLQIPYLDN
ncbi:MAG: Co2+/Mg2+ efflux protein ApaG [Bacteroidia bacterium]|nr:Co2+/Mg2+ efflux protein ApaG [Bacteroidia bacterium]